MAEMRPLKSSNLAACGYDDATREMTVEFTSGAQYTYEGVPREIYDGLMASPSPGSYLHRNVRDSYRSRKI